MNRIIISYKKFRSIKIRIIRVLNRRTDFLVKLLELLRFLYHILLIMFMVNIIHSNKLSFYYSFLKVFLHLTSASSLSFFLHELKIKFADRLFDLILTFYKFFPVWLRNPIISAGLELVLTHTKKSCIASYYKQFSTNTYYLNKNHKK